MKKNKNKNLVLIPIIILILLILFLAIIFLLIQKLTNPPSNYFQSVSLNNQPFYLEVAKTTEEKSQGLMFRESLPKNHGMIFIYNEDKERSFWMKNTLIPLDLIFISSNNTIVEIKENIQPCEIENCPSYKSKPAKYVIEINAGLSEEIGLTEGNVVILD